MNEVKSVLKNFWNCYYISIIMNLFEHKTHIHKTVRNNMLGGVSMIQH